MPRTSSPRRGAEVSTKPKSSTNKPVSWSLLDLPVGQRWQWILIEFLALWWSFVWLHYREYQRFNTVQILMSFFFALNFLISLWEIALGLEIKKIRIRHLQTRTLYRGSEFEFVGEVMSQPTRLRDLWSTSYWGEIWSTYAIFDSAYASQHSFGFFIDVGNGWTTLLPSFLGLYGMTFDTPLSPQFFALLGMLTLYQAWYGTVIYFLSFVWNGRYANLSWLKNFLFVGCTNGIWFTLPLLGIWANYQVLNTHSFAVYRQ